MTEKRIKKEKSIVTWIVFRISLVFIVAMLLITVVFTIFTSTYMRNNILHTQKEQVAIAANSMETRFNGLVGPMISLARYSPTLGLLGQDYEFYTAEWIADIRYLDAYLKNVNMFSEYILDIVLIRNDSITVYSMANRLRRDYDYLNSEWFIQAVGREGLLKYAPPRGTEHLYHDSGENTLSVIYPIYRSNILIGYILMECNLERFAYFLVNRNLEESGFLLLDDQGIIIYDYQQQRIDLDFATIFSLDELLAGESISFEIEGKLYIAHRLLANNWVLISESDIQMILLPTRQWLLVVLILGVLFFLLLIGITVYNSKQMEKPFNTLIKLKQKEMELEALTNQVNPHFLYNVFQVIQTKAVLVDNREVEDMIQALSQMMRYTMERKRDKVRIQDEVNYIERYLMFYKQRFSQLFDYELVCEPDVLNYKTLKFILQPVVENCFKHAFKDRKTGGIIRIHIFEKETEVLFEVWDNGCGITAEKIRQIQDKLDNETEENGIGIINTSSRIHLVYGQQYGIQINSVVDEYTSVIIRIMKEDDGDNNVSSINSR